MRHIKITRHVLCLGLLSLITTIHLYPDTFTVTTAADNGDNTSPTAGSLRAAILASNAASPGPNIINFSISGTGPFTIQPREVLPNDLPNITTSVTIDGYTQPGASANTLAQGDNAVLQIILNGSNYSGDGLATGNGLHFAPTGDEGSSVDNSVVRGLVINQWIDNGILLDTTNAPITGVSIVGNFIGTDVTGTVQMANRCGIGLSPDNDCYNCIIGTPAFADRNLIAGSFGVGFDNYGVEGGFSLFAYGAYYTTIQNNYVGTDVTGTRVLGNSHVGICLRNDLGDIVGGSSPSERNLVSGQTVWGIRLRGLANSTVQGNYVGTDITGTKALGNGNAGIAMHDTFAPIGGTAGSVVTNNLISGNGYGLVCGDNEYPGCILNTIQNNKIGTDISGTVALPNSRFGIVIDDLQNTVTGNLVSGNLGGGILVYSSLTTSTIVTNNLIGTDVTGTKAIPNGGNGIQVGLNGAFGGTSDNTIGS